MSRFLGAALIMTICSMGASLAQAQNVGIAGEYHESNGVIVNIPQNPPSIDCAADDTAWNAQNDARCHRIRQAIGGAQLGPIRYVQPFFGNYGAQLGTAASTTLPSNPTPGAAAAGLNPGDAFKVPAQMMNQRLGRQVGIVLNNPVRQLDTTFTVVAPGAARQKNPPADTRVFNAGGWVGQDNGQTGTLQEVRTAAAQTHTGTFGAETVVVSYNGGTRGFGGTMTSLLDGQGRLYIKNVGLSAAFPSSLRPIIATNPVGDTIPNLTTNTRNAAGWNYTTTGSQMVGYGKGYGVYPASVQAAIIGPDCALTPPPTPAGCNEINFWESAFPGIPATGTGMGAPGGGVAPGVNFGPVIPPAQSTKHMFAYTTGTVVVSRVGVRSFGTVTDTVTAKGYDTVSTGGQRNVGLVAGSYSKRTSLSGAGEQRQINSQMTGLNMKFTPEPGATVALMSGLGLLGALAARRRS